MEMMPDFSGAMGTGSSGLTSLRKTSKKLKNKPWNLEFYFPAKIKVKLRHFR